MEIEGAYCSEAIRAGAYGIRVSPGRVLTRSL
jgi:hypothetical protein